MKNLELHTKRIEELQKQLRSLFVNKETSPIALQYGDGHSNTTRSKSYKNRVPALDFGTLHHILKIDPEKRIAIVEPRVTIEALIKALLPYKLTVPVVPEFKGITVGGAIMGYAAESSSHRYGTFNDICTSFELLTGNGTLMRASPHENTDLFYGAAGSYGSLGALTSAELSLIPIQNYIQLTYHIFPNPADTVTYIQKLLHTTHAPDFLDGIIFAKDLAVVIEGTMQHSSDAPQFSLRSSSAEWYYQHVQHIASTQSTSYTECMPFEDFCFRYDQGAFWMGSYLFKFPFLTRFVLQGVFNLWTQAGQGFSENEIHKFYNPQAPNLLERVLSHPFMNSQTLWKLLHKAENWVNDRAIIQDFCIPEANSVEFLKEALDTGVFPIWLCPIKGTHTPQIFAPHLIPNDDKYVINFGIYGIPSSSTSIAKVTRMLEQKTKALDGRKVLYSRSYYTPDEFWKIYPRQPYEDLRMKTHAKHIWHDITEKILSK